MLGSFGLFSNTRSFLCSSALQTPAGPAAPGRGSGTLGAPSSDPGSDGAAPDTVPVSPWVTSSPSPLSWISHRLVLALVRDLMST